MKEIERPDVERAAGEVHACWCFGFDDHGYELTRFGDFQSSQFDGFRQPSQAMTAVGVYGKATTLTPGNRLVLGRAEKSAATGGAVAGNELGPVFLLLRECGIGLEAAAAAGFVGAHGANDDQLLAFDEALGVNRGVAAANTNRQQLGDLFGDGEKARHRFERAATVIGVQAGNDDAFAEIGELGANIHYLIAKKLRFVDADYFRAWRKFFHDFGGFEDVVRRNAEAGVRDDFVGGIAFVDGRLDDLQTLARDFRAAQTADQLFTLAGKHRANDDFDPAHIPFDDVHDDSFNFRQRSCNQNTRHSAPLHLGTGSGCSAVHLLIIERSERGKHGNSKSFLARDEIA